MCSIGTGSSSSTFLSASWSSSLCLRPAPGGGGQAAGGRLDVAGAVTVTTSLMLAVYAIVNGNQEGWTSAQTLGLLGDGGSAAGTLPRDRGSDSLAADAARALPAAQCRDRERGRRPLGRRHVRLVLPLRSLSPAGARVQPTPGRSRLPAGQPDHGGVLARALRQARLAVRLQDAAWRRASVDRPSGSSSLRGLRSTGASPSTCFRA